MEMPMLIVPRSYRVHFACSGFPQLGHSILQLDGKLRYVPPACVCNPVDVTRTDSAHSQYSEVVKAAQAARTGNLEQAADHLEKAQEDIDVVVRTRLMRHLPFSFYHRRLSWAALSCNSVVS